MTKFYSLPGLRLGYAIAHPDRLQLASLRPWPVNTRSSGTAESRIQGHNMTWAWLPPARLQHFRGFSPNIVPATRWRALLLC